MPNLIGGDQCDKEYAPHMWIGDNFIAGTGKEIKVGAWCYYAGRTDDETLVAERWLPKTESKDLFQERDLVSDSEIPQEVREAINKNAFSKRQSELAEIEVLFNLVLSTK